MVLEGILNPFKAEKHPIDGLFLGFLYASVAVLLALWIFEAYAGLVAVFLTVLATTPLIYGIIKREEEKDLVQESEIMALKDHIPTLKFLLFLFIGISLAIAAWYIFLPQATASTTFSIQQQTISTINQATGSTTQTSALTKIFLNNIKVLTFSLLFAFIYGVGASFILTWNASVIGVAIGNLIRTNLSQYANSAGFSKVAGYLQITTLSIFRYSIHGIPEILAYFIAGLAGSIISIAIIKHDFLTKKFERVLLDSADLIVIAIVILIIAALLEVFVTPAIFSRLL